MKLWPVTLTELLVLGTLSTATAAEQDSASSRTTKAPRPVVIATDTFVRPSSRNFAGLPQATMFSVNLRPRAVRFVGQHDRTYITFGDQQCHPAIVFYDHRQKEWSKPLRIGKTGVPYDVHGIPVLAIDSKGFLHVVYGAHGGTQWARRSSNPEQIDQWDTPVVASPNATYANLFFVGDTLYWFHREQRNWGFRTSPDGGKTWSEFRVTCPNYESESGPGVFYPGVWLGDEKPVPRMHMFWMYYYHRGSWEDIHYAVSYDLGNTWHKADGQRIGDRVEYGAGDVVYKGPTRGWPQQIVIDPSGRPGLIFGTGGPALVDNNTILFAYLNGTQWQVSKICEAASFFTYGGVLIKGPDHYLAYVPVGKKWNGGEIGQFETTDGGRTWQRVRLITRDSPAPNAFPVIIENASPELQIVWCSGDKDIKGKVYAWGEADGLSEQADPVIGLIEE